MLQETSSSPSTTCKHQLSHRLQAELAGLAHHLVVSTLLLIFFCLLSHYILQCLPHSLIHHNQSLIQMAFHFTISLTDLLILLTGNLPFLYSCATFDPTNCGSKCLHWVIIAQKPHFKLPASASESQNIESLSSSVVPV